MSTSPARTASLSTKLEMGLMVTDQLTLQLQQTFRNVVFAHQAETVEDTNRAFRHASYQQYVLWVFVRLQKMTGGQYKHKLCKTNQEKLPQLNRREHWICASQLDW